MADYICRNLRNMRGTTIDAISGDGKIAAVLASRRFKQSGTASADGLRLPAPPALVDHHV